MPDSVFTDDRPYVVTATSDVGDRQRRIAFLLADGRRGAIIVDSAFDVPLIRDKLILAWAEGKRNFGGEERII